jgi:hypothetical protein
VWFTTLVVLQGFLQPEYSHVRLPVSALAAWPTGWIQIVNFLVVGVLTMAFAVALRLGVLRTRGAGVGFALLLASGVGLIIAGISPWKMIDGALSEPLPHVVGAIMTFACTGTGLIAFSRGMRSDPRWRDLAGYTLATGIAVLVLFVIVGFFAIDEGTPFHPWAGLIQRILAAVWFACMIVMAIRLRAVFSARATDGL